MKKFRNYKSGLILTEALVALATLTTGVIVLSSIINNAVSTLAVSRDYMIAQNFVTEGVEIVKAIRDSNWLILPSKKECWLTIDPFKKLGAENVNCAVGPAIAAKNYIPKSGANSFWKLEDIGANSPALNLTLLLGAPNSVTKNKQEKYILSKEDLGNEKYRYIQVDNDLNNSKFYRSIVFTEATKTQATYEVKVQWLDGARVRTIKRQTTLYNDL